MPAVGRLWPSDDDEDDNNDEDDDESVGDRRGDVGQHDPDTSRPAISVVRLPRSSLLFPSLPFFALLEKMNLKGSDKVSALLMFYVDCSCFLCSGVTFQARPSILMPIAPHWWRGDASHYQEIELRFVHNRIADKHGKARNRVRAENSVLLTPVR